jgi:hypothetical protein
MKTRKCRRRGWFICSFWNSPNYFNILCCNANSRYGDTQQFLLCLSIVMSARSKYPHMPMMREWLFLRKVSTPLCYLFAEFFISYVVSQHFVFRRVRKIAKSDYQLRPALVRVCGSVCMEQLDSHWTVFHESWYLSNFRKSPKKIQVSLKSDMNNGHFAWRLIHIYYHISWETVTGMIKDEDVIRKMFIHILLLGHIIEHILFF